VATSHLPKDAGSNAAFQIGLITNRHIAAESDPAIGRLDVLGAEFGQLANEQGLKATRAGCKKLVQMVSLSLTPRNRRWLLQVLRSRRDSTKSRNSIWCSASSALALSRRLAQRRSSGSRLNPNTRILPGRPVASTSTRPSKLCSMRDR